MWLHPTQTERKRRKRRKKRNGREINKDFKQLHFFHFRSNDWTPLKDILSLLFFCRRWALVRNKTMCEPLTFRTYIAPVFLSQIENDIIFVDSSFLEAKLCVEWKLFQCNLWLILFISPFSSFSMNERRGREKERERENRKSLERMNIKTKGVCCFLLLHFRKIRFFVIDLFEWQWMEIKRWSAKHGRLYHWKNVESISLIQQ